jgi:hypothetical protein
MTMTRSRKIWITVAAALLFFFVVLPGGLYLLARTSCVPNEADYHLVIESQIPTDVTVMNQEMNDEGEQIYEETLGSVPAGQTENLTLVMPLPKGRTVDSIKRSVVATIQLRAEDPVGNVVWQKAWSKEEFWDLKKEGWRIVISPETNEE